MSKITNDILTRSAQDICTHMATVGIKGLNWWQCAWCQHQWHVGVATVPAPVTSRVTQLYVSVGTGDHWTVLCWSKVGTEAWNSYMTRQPIVRPQWML